MANEPGADKDGRRSDRAETKESGTAGDSQEEAETDQMKKNEVLPKRSGQHFAPTPQLVKSDEIDIWNKSIDEDERDQTNDVGRYMYRWDLMEIGSGRVDFTGRQKSERK